MAELIRRAVDAWLEAHRNSGIVAIVQDEVQVELTEQQKQDLKELLSRDPKAPAVSFAIPATGPVRGLPTGPDSVDEIQDVPPAEHCPSILRLDDGTCPGHCEHLEGHKGNHALLRGYTVYKWTDKADGTQEVTTAVVSTFLDEMREGSVDYPAAPDQGVLGRHFLESNSTGDNGHRLDVAHTNVADDVLNAIHNDDPDNILTPENLAKHSQAALDGVKNLIVGVDMASGNDELRRVEGGGE